MLAQLFVLLRLALVVVYSRCGASTSRGHAVALRWRLRRCCNSGWRSRRVLKKGCELLVAESRSCHPAFEVFAQRNVEDLHLFAPRNPGAVGVLGGHSTARLADAKPMRLDARAAARVFNCQYELFNSINQLSSRLPGGHGDVHGHP